MAKIKRNPAATFKQLHPIRSKNTLQTMLCKLDLKYNCCYQVKLMTFLNLFDIFNGLTYSMFSPASKL